MTKEKIKDISDYLPLIILVVCSISLLYVVSTTNIGFSYEHYIGLAMLVITSGVFIKRHKLGVLMLGVTLMLGMLRLLSYSAAITSVSFAGSVNDLSSPNIKIQPIFLLWLLIHFLVSGRHYKGIGTKKYWKNLLASNSRSNILS